VDLGEALTGLHKGSEVRCIRDAWEFALEVGLVFIAISRVMEETINVVKDVPLGNGLVDVVLMKLSKCPVCDVLAAIFALLVLEIKRKAL